MQEEGNHILILFATSAALIFLIIILAFTFLISYQKKIVSQKLRMQESENEFQLKLLQASIESQEKERKRIASDLHDEIGSLLSGLKTNIGYLKNIDKIGEDERAFLERTSELLDDGLTNVRRISYDLLPPTLSRFGLWEALNELVKDVSFNKEIIISTDFTPALHYTLAEEVQLSIFRVIKELLSNSFHEPSVSHIEINTQQMDETLTISYKDNGNGFTTQSQPHGLGIVNMKSRIQSISGTIQLSTISDDHFFATISIPLNSETNELK